MNDERVRQPRPPVSTRSTASGPIRWPTKAAPPAPRSRAGSPSARSRGALRAKDEITPAFDDSDETPALPARLRPAPRDRDATK